MPIEKSSGKFSENQKQMLIAQAASLSALFCWYPEFSKKLDQQIAAIKERDLKTPSANPWKGICRQMVFQPVVPIIFGVKDRILRFFTQDDKLPATPGKVILATSIAGALTGPYCNAGEVYVIRRKYHPNENWHQALRHISKESGLRSFFKGTFFMAMRNALYAGVFFGVNPSVQKQLNQKVTLESPTDVVEKGKKLAINVCSSVFSAVLACSLTMPFDNISVQRQTNALGIDKTKSNLELIRRIYSHSGWRGFYVGTKLRCRQIVKEFVVFSLCFSFYSRLVEKRYANH